MKIIIESKKPEEMSAGLDWIRQNLSGQFDKTSNNIVSSDDIKNKDKAKEMIDLLRGKFFLVWERTGDNRFLVLINYAGENRGTNWLIKRNFMETFRQIDKDLREI